MKDTNKGSDSSSEQTKIRKTRTERRNASSTARMMIDLWNTPTGTKSFEPESETIKKLPKTIKRRHSYNSMMKFLSHREALFMIPEVPSIEEQYASKSFTAGTHPLKPRTRKFKKKKKSTVSSSLAKALSIVNSNSVNKKYNSTNQSSQNSVTTCSTASLTDEDSDISSKGHFEKREAREGKREAASLCEAPLLRGNRRWCEQSQYLGDEHYLYAKVRRRRCDVPPICPVRR